MNLSLACEGFLPDEGKSAVIFIGIPASGKSTFYSRFFRETHVHINLDTIHTRNKEKTLLDECVSLGRSFVVDNTNPTAFDRERYISAIKGKSYRIYGYFFRGNITDCIKRNSYRTGKARVPDRAITAISSKMQPPKYSEGFDKIYFVDQVDGDFSVDGYIEF